MDRERVVLGVVFIPLLVYGVANVVFFKAVPPKNLIHIERTDSGGVQFRPEHNDGCPCCTGVAPVATR